MPRYAISPETLLPPSSFSPFLKVSFRIPFESRDPIYPASSLQLSFARPGADDEIFLEQHLTARDVSHTDAGLCSVMVRQEALPRYAYCRGRDVGEVTVKLHAWKGERHLGAWEVGTLNGPGGFTLPIRGSLA